MDLSYEQSAPGTSGPRARGAARRHPASGGIRHFTPIMGSRPAPGPSPPACSADCCTPATSAPRIRSIRPAEAVPCSPATASPGRRSAGLRQTCTAMAESISGSRSGLPSERSQRPCWCRPSTTPPPQRGPPAGPAPHPRSGAGRRPPRRRPRSPGSPLGSSRSRRSPWQRSTGRRSPRTSPRPRRSRRTPPSAPGDHAGEQRPGERLGAALHHAHQQRQYQEVGRVGHEVAEHADARVDDEADEDRRAWRRCGWRRSRTGRRTGSRRTARS